jgi:L-asparaginase II
VAQLFEDVLGDEDRATELNAQRDGIARAAVDLSLAAVLAAEHEESVERAAPQIGDDDALDGGVRGAQEIADQVVGQRALGLETGDLAVDLEGLIGPDHDREAPLPASLSQTDDLLVVSFVDHDLDQLDLDFLRHASFIVATFALSTKGSERVLMEPPVESPASGSSHPILVELERGHVRESRHRGSYVVVGEQGVLCGAGGFEEGMLPRSALKPLQLLPFFNSGGPDRLGLDPEQRAVLCASHSSDEGHIAAVREILRRADVPESALGCGPHDPIDRAAARRLWARGEEPGCIHNNCSGKHSGFLARARELGASLADYLDPAHPVQAELRDVLNRLGGLELRAEDAVFDGCGAPMYRFSLRVLAEMFRDIANWERLPEDLRVGGEGVFRAFTGAPHFIAGYGEPGQLRIDTPLMQAAAGRLFCKCGAEGVFGVGVRRGDGQPGLGLAIKIDDGNKRAYEAFVPELLRQLGVLRGDEAELAAFFDRVVHNTQGKQVGRYVVAPLSECGQPAARGT